MKEGRLARMGEKIGSCHTARLLASLLAHNAYAASFFATSFKQDGARFEKEGNW